MCAVYPAETPPCSWSFRSLQGRVIGWRAHNSTPLQSRNVMCDAFVASPVCHGYPRASDMDSTREVAYCKTELLARRFIGTCRRCNSAGESTSVPGSNYCFTIGFRGELRDFYTLGNLSFGVPIQRSEQHNLLAGCGEDIPLVNMEDRMLDRFADHQS